MRMMVVDPDYIYIEIDIGDGILIDRPDEYDADDD